ncbi:hypothetical protein [Mucilaginibacter sp. SP1R1]|uniref:hypothetical protein n=1 Tax=Mucilaginibacter sp. SP1R1 TaxID=2723091 RepID=UPI001622199F|nr:hypothetical protein [Mucilaginibacter sp. SP1R1]MBB6151478.1 hypothetical protein [Mucilaginibacter sp. SP1R1]
MQNILINCNYDILKKYSYRVDYLVSKNIFSSKFTHSIPVEFNINPDVSKSGAVTFTSFKNILEKHYPTIECDNKLHTENLFYLFDELNKEIHEHTIQWIQYEENIESLKFLRDLLKMREYGLDNLEIVIRKKNNPSKNATASLNKQNLVDPNLISTVIDRFKLMRFSNEHLFNSIEPSDFSSIRVTEIIDKLEPVNTHKIQFQIAHYCIILIQYFNYEIEVNERDYKPSAKQLRLLFDLLSFFNFSQFAIKTDELLFYKDAKSKYSAITRELKKYLENHRNSASFSYNKKMV